MLIIQEISLFVVCLFVLDLSSFVYELYKFEKQKKIIQYIKMCGVKLNILRS